MKPSEGKNKLAAPFTIPPDSERARWLQLSYSPQPSLPFSLPQSGCQIMFHPQAAHLASGKSGLHSILLPEQDYTLNSWVGGLKRLKSGGIKSNVQSSTPTLPSVMSVICGMQVWVRLPLGLNNSLFLGHRSPEGRRWPMDALTSRNRQASFCSAFIQPVFNSANTGSVMWAGSWMINSQASPQSAVTIYLENWTRTNGKASFFHTRLENVD